MRHLRLRIRAHAARPGIECAQCFFFDGVGCELREFDAGQILRAIVGLVAGQALHAFIPIAEDAPAGARGFLLQERAEFARLGAVHGCEILEQEWQCEHIGSGNCFGEYAQRHDGDAGVIKGRQGIRGRGGFQRQACVLALPFFRSGPRQCRTLGGNADLERVRGRASEYGREKADSAEQEKSAQPLSAREHTGILNGR